MPFVYRDRIYPYLVSRMGDPKPDSRPSSESHSLGSRNVLEVGSGAGATFGITIPRESRSLRTGIKRTDDCARRAAAPCEFSRRISGAAGERIPLQDASVDSVASTHLRWHDSRRSFRVRGMRRVLQPEGKLIFLELDWSLEAAVRRWQKRWEPAAHWLFEGKADSALRLWKRCISPHFQNRGHLVAGAPHEFQGTLRPCRLAWRARRGSKVLDGYPIGLFRDSNRLPSDAACTGRTIAASSAVGPNPAIEQAVRRQLDVNQRLNLTIELKVATTLPGTALLKIGTYLLRSWATCSSHSRERWMRLDACASVMVPVFHWSAYSLISVVF